MSLYEHVIAHAQRQPDHLAVHGPDCRLTYGELDRLAALWAGALAARGIQRGDRVALYLRKSSGAVAMMQAILRLGAVYVPFDPFSPPGRVTTIARHCGARLVIGESSLLGEPEHGLLQDIPMLNIERMSADPPLQRPVPVQGHDPAYILYTSGSTGEPKGVCLSHQNAEAFIEWVVATINAGPNDRFANHAPFHFDLSVLDLYAAFRAGASVHLIPESQSYLPRELNRLLVETRISVWYSVPSVLMLMMAEVNFPAPAELNLRVLFFAGEPFPIKPLHRLFNALHPPVRFFNLYGPTETNVCTAYEVQHIPDGRGEPVPIGAACSGDRVWAADAAGRPVAVGEEGQLMVDGPTVMLGYHGAAPLAGTPYATGDWVRRLDEHNYQYLSRLDQMVKIRGYRVELGAIETALLLHPRVEMAAVVVEGDGLEARLVAYLTTKTSPPTLIEIKRHCAQHLPPYMIVDRIRILPSLPLNGNGKLDRRRLYSGVGVGGAHG